MKKPKPLFPGARVALLAPSGPVPEEKRGPAAEAVRALGLEPVVFPSADSAHGYLAGDDAMRANDLNRAFADPSIDGILCIRGGYGAQRLLDLLDYGMIARHPKFFCGYSDITALHIVFLQKCGFCTYHTPMPSTEWIGLTSEPSPEREFSLESLRRMLFGAPPADYVNPPPQALHTLVPGKAQGALTGGNLSLVASSIGTPYEIDTYGKILFLEDLEEEPYRIDRMLTQLRNAGKLDDCSGLLLGYWTNCDAAHPERSLTLEQVLDERIVPAGKPCIQDFACGHALPTLSLELGSAVELDADALHVTLVE